MSTQLRSSCARNQYGSVVGVAASPPRNERGLISPYVSKYPYLARVPQISDEMRDLLALGYEPTAEEEERERARLDAAMAELRRVYLEDKAREGEDPFDRLEDDEDEFGSSL